MREMEIREQMKMAKFKRLMMMEVTAQITMNAAVVFVILDAARRSTTANIAAIDGRGQTFNLLTLNLRRLGLELVRHIPAAAVKAFIRHRF
jgi:hypothetical protein